MNDPIREWRDMDPADRGLVIAGLRMAALMCGHVSADRSENPDIVSLARLGRSCTETAVAALSEVAHMTKVPPILGPAVRSLVGEIETMDRPLQLIANIALLDRAVFPEAFCEALSALVLALRPAPADPETKP